METKKQNGSDCGDSYNGERAGICHMPSTASYMYVAACHVPLAACDCTDQKAANFLVPCRAIEFVELANSSSELSSQSPGAENLPITGARHSKQDGFT